MRKINRAFALLLALILGITACSSVKTATKEEAVVLMSETLINATPEPTYEPLVVTVSETDIIEENKIAVSEEDIELIALVTMAEAEGECEEGKRLVIDTILNRVGSKYFPDTIYDVIYQPYHFSSMWNGRVDRCEVRADICALVREELESRTNTNVIFFMAGQYSRYGVPLFQVENHYFSSYD